MEIRDFVLNNLLSGFSGMSYDQAAEAREALANPDQVEEMRQIYCSIADGTNEEAAQEFEKALEAMEGTLAGLTLVVGHGYPDGEASSIATNLCNHMTSSSPQR